MYTRLLLRVSIVLYVAVENIRTLQPLSTAFIAIALDFKGQDGLSLSLSA